MPRLAPEVAAAVATVRRGSVTRSLPQAWREWTDPQVPASLTSILNRFGVQRLYFERFDRAARVLTDLGVDLDTLFAFPYGMGLDDTQAMIIACAGLSRGEVADIYQAVTRAMSRADAWGVTRVAGGAVDFTALVPIVALRRPQAFAEPA